MRSCVCPAVPPAGFARAQLAIKRNPVIRNSRPTTVVAAQAGIALIGTSEMNAAAIMILSTSGSMSFPKFVTHP